MAVVLDGASVDEEPFLAVFGGSAFACKRFLNHALIVERNVATLPVRPVIAVSFARGVILCGEVILWHVAVRSAAGTFAEAVSLVAELVRTV